MNFLMFFIAFFTFLLYYLTLYPSCAGGDSGELITAAYALVSAHPPGYPLFLLLTKAVITVIPYGSVAWRANLLSAVLTSLTSFPLFASIQLLLLSSTHVKNEKNETTAVAVGVFVCLYVLLHPLYWLYAISAEVFALNNFLCANFIYLTLLLISLQSTNANANENDDITMIAKRKTRLEIIWAVNAALLGANQHTSVLFVIPCVLYVMLPSIWKKIIGEYRQSSSSIANAIYAVISSVIHIALSFIIPFIGLYSYIPITAYYNAKYTQMAWGGINASTMSGFFRILFRSDYGTFQLANLNPLQPSAASTTTTTSSDSNLFWKLYHNFLRELIFGFTVNEPDNFIKNNSTNANNSNNYASASFYATFVMPIILFFGCLSFIFALYFIIFNEKSAATQIPSSSSSSAAVISPSPKKKKNINTFNSTTAVTKTESSSTAIPSLRLLLFLVLISTAFFNHLANLDPDDNQIFFETVRRFWMQPTLPLSLIFAFGLHRLLIFLSNRVGNNLIFAFGSLTILLFGFILSFRYDEMDYSEDTTILEYGLDIFKSIPFGGILLAKGDHASNIVRYLQECEGYRPDVTIIVQSLITLRWHTLFLAEGVLPSVLPTPIVFPGKYLYIDPIQPTDLSFYHHHKDGGNAYSWSKFLVANGLFNQSRQLFFCPGPIWSENYDKLFELAQVRPTGLCYLIIPKNITNIKDDKRTADFANIWWPLQKNYFLTERMILQSKHPRAWENQVLKERRFIARNIIQYLINIVQQTKDKQMLLEAANILEDLICKNEDIIPFPDCYNNILVATQQLDFMHVKGARARLVAAANSYRALNCTTHSQWQLNNELFIWLQRNPN